MGHSHVGCCARKIPELQRDQENVGFGPREEGDAIQECSIPDVHKDCHGTRKNNQQQLNP
jgi:hypothetical protein